MASTGVTQSVTKRKQPSTKNAPEGLSLIHGPSQPELYIRTLGSMIHEQAAKYGDRTAVKSVWQSVHLSYRELAEQSELAAKALIALGMKHGECVGVMAGNCYQYLEIVLGAGRIGCPVVALNNTFSPAELESAVVRSNCKLVFIASHIGARALTGHARGLLESKDPAIELEHLVTIGETGPWNKTIRCQIYDQFLSFGKGKSSDISNKVLEERESKVDPSDVLNLQFTSGTNGRPKAASLTHIGLINNARFVGNAMRLTPEDVVCCSPPLFHCFGLVMGFLSSFCYGSTLVFPSDNFNAQLTVEAVVYEKVTALLGVPTMFYAELDALEKTNLQITTVRTGLASGSSVPRVLMESLRKNMNVHGMLIAYGMTETSPVTFLTSLDDSEERMLSTIGRPFPHTSAKVIDGEGNIVPIGTRGELCTSGFALQKGYWKDEEKTKEVMIPDENGVVWMHTGDEALLDAEGYGHITGRMKDMIIRGGENLSPAEIENRLLSHPAIAECCVVGLANEKYGEVVGCFLKPAGKPESRISDDEVRSWVKQTLGPAQRSCCTTIRSRIMKLESIRLFVGVSNEGNIHTHS